MQVQVLYSVPFIYLLFTLLATQKQVDWLPFIPIRVCQDIMNLLCQ